MKHEQATPSDCERPEQAGPPCSAREHVFAVSGYISLRLRWIYEKKKKREKNAWRKIILTKKCNKHSRIPTLKSLVRCEKAALCMRFIGEGNHNWVKFAGRVRNIEQALTTTHRRAVDRAEVSQRRVRGFPVARTGWRKF